MNKTIPLQKDFLDFGSEKLCCVPPGGSQQIGFKVHRSKEIEGMCK